MAVELKILVNAAINLETLRKFVLEGNLHEMIADADLMAARDALEKRKLANNPDDQIKSAINHMESAIGNYKQILKKEVTIFSSLYKFRLLHDISNKCVLTFCLMAICCKLVGEEELCIKAFEHAKEYLNGPIKTSAAKKFHSTIFWPLAIVPQLLDPRVWRQHFKEPERNLDIYWVKKLEVVLVNRYDMILPCSIKLEDKLKWR